MSRKLLIRGGRLVDPAAGKNGRLDVLLADGRVAEVGDRVEAGDAEVFDASRLLVLPGFVDLHTHLREPGREYAETISTGLAAAAAGGFTAVCAMPNTNPVNDSRETCEFLRLRGEIARGARLYPIGGGTRFPTQFRRRVIVLDFRGQGRCRKNLRSLRRRRQPR